MGVSAFLWAGRLEPGFRTDQAHISALNGRFGDSVKQGLKTGVAQGTKRLFVDVGIKLVAVAIFIFIIMQAMDHIQGAISDLTTPNTRPASRQAVSPQPVARQRQQPTTIYRKQPSTGHTQQPSIQTQARQREWELTLRCGYSIDTNRCACYDRKGIKAMVEFGRCKALATGDRN
jgi:hypothetical protein